MTGAVSLGVDLGERGVRVAVREGRGREHAIRIAFEGLDGSDSVQPSFWHAVATELTAYLGGYPLSEIPLNVVLPAGAKGQLGGDIRQAARKAGFASPGFLARADAVGARWLYEASEIEGVAMVMALYIGEDALEHARYAVTFAATSSKLTPYDTPVAVTCAANDAHLEHVVGLVRDVLPGALADWEQEMLRSAAYEMGSSLRLLAEHERRSWQSPLADRLTVPLSFSPHDAAAWRPARELGRAIERILAEPTAGGRLIVGGAGAIWPGVWSTARRLGFDTVLWMSPDPWHDAAVGAALWSLMGPTREWFKTPVPESASEGVVRREGRGHEWSEKPPESVRRTALKPPSER